MAISLLIQIKRKKSLNIRKPFLIIQNPLSGLKSGLTCFPRLVTGYLSADRRRDDIFPASDYLFLFPFVISVPKHRVIEKLERKARG